MNSNIQRRIEEWSKDPFCSETILEVSKLKKDPAATIPFLLKNKIYIDIRTCANIIAPTNLTVGKPESSISNLLQKALVLKIVWNA